MIAAVILAVALAQDTSRTPRLALADVYRDVHEASPRVQAARALVSAARARVGPAKLPPDPTLQFGLMNYAVPGFAPMEQIGMAQLQLMQMIPTAGKPGLSGRVALAQANAVSARADDVAWDVRARTAMAFYDLYATDAGLDVARQTLRLLDDILRTAESMYRVGEGRQTDVLRAQVEVARMTEDTIRMTAMRTGMAARLNVLANRPAEAPVGSPALPSFPDSIPALSILLEASQHGRPMVKAGERDVDAANARATLMRREIWPDVTIGLQYGQRGSAMGGTDRMASLMVGASLPVFSNRRQLQMREEAGAMRLMAEAELAAMRAETRAAVTAAYANLARSRRLAALYRSTIIPQADATTGSALAAYRVGGVDFMTLLDARMTANRYRQDVFSLEADEGKAWAELEMLLGRELFTPTTVAHRSPPRPREGQP